MKVYKRCQEKVREFWYLLNYPHGVDEKYDEECDSAFHRFLDCLYYVLVCSFVLFGSVSAYFFITYELLGDG